jgi:hypothetical protein
MLVDMNPVTQCMVVSSSFLVLVSPYLRCNGRARVLVVMQGLLAAAQLHRCTA